MHLYAIVLQYVDTEVVEIHDSMEAAEAARLSFAKRSIPNYNEVWNRYLTKWQDYHACEYPDHPSPSREIILDQFLSEACHIGIREFNVGEPAKANPDYFQTIGELV